MKMQTCANKAARALCASALAAGLMIPSGVALASSSDTDVADASFTVTGVNVGDTVKAYQVFDADIDANNNLTYTAKVSGLPTDYDTADELVGKDGRVVADAIASAVTAGDPTYSAVASDKGEVTFSLDSGVYLVTVTTTSGRTKVYQTMLVNASPVVSAQGTYTTATLDSVTAKSSDVTKPTKNIVTTSGEVKESDQYSVGDTVNFRISGTIPSYPSNATHVTYSLTDVPQSGLGVNQTSFVVKDINDKTVDATNYDLVVSDGKYTIQFKESYIRANTGKTVKVEYSAVVNKVDTATGKVGNEAYGTFNPNPYDKTTVDTEPDRTVEKTYGFTFKKVGKDANNDLKALAGAEFTIYDKETNKAVAYMDAKGNVVSTGVVASDSNGYVYANGLKKGTYIVKETKVPSGYQKISDITITLDENDTSNSPATETVTETNFDVTTADQEDPKHGELPTTGGAGTIALTAGGILLVVGGSAVILRSRRRDQD